jgi:Sensors of blue-light using FAD
MKLVRLIYASRLTEPLAKSQVQKILAVSNQNNSNAAITGYLCISQHYVLQCLEGSRDAVNTLYNRITSDERHKEVTLMRYVESWRRLFPGWHMGFSNELSSAAPESSRWRDANGFNPYLVDSDLIESVIEELCNRSERLELRA